jgi:hypothetical protein
VHGEVALFTESVRENPVDDDLSRSIGVLTCRDDELIASVWLPTERFGDLVAISANGRVQSVTVLGTRLRYRRANAHSIGIFTELNDEDWPVSCPAKAPRRQALR